MSLNRKDFEIIRLVSVEKIKLKELASNFKTTDRNIRYSIDNINHYLKVISSKDKIEVINGVIKINRNENLIERFCGEENRFNYMFSKEEREEYIVITILFQDRISLKKLESYFQVSTTTLRKDLKEIDKNLEKYQLCIKNYLGELSIVGNEKKLRHLKMIYALKYMYLNAGKINYVSDLFFFQKDILLILKKYLEKQDAYKCFEILKTFEKKLDIAFEKEFKNIIYIYLVITFERIEKGYVILKKNNSEFLKNTLYYKVIQKDIFKNNGVYMYEALHLSEYFLSGYNSENFYEDRFLIDSFICKLLSVLKDIKIRNLINNREFLEEVIEYLRAAIYRVKNNFILNSEIKLDEIENKIFIEILQYKIKMNTYLNEPLRDEEFMMISRIIYKHLIKQKKEKIKLKEVIQIIQKNSKNCYSDLIAKELLELYPNLIENDIDFKKQLGLLDIVTEKNIKFTRCVDIKELIDLSFNDLYDNSFIELEFTESIHKMLEDKKYDYLDSENMIIFYGKELKYKKELGVSIFFNESVMKIDDKKIKYLILLSNVDEYNYLGVSRDLQKIIESVKFKELEKLNSEKDVMRKFEEVIQGGASGL
ncbi:helix-turn-helix domain-containing protein [uncultured Cetobacterium sp.]|uniref:helix-turn-helix domain-containing protein n=1 Tax=uncultured Cetobacterium sp. TaxID=527638 RepID=UPI0025F19543|nr:helix-turn-helix domain-containing protein [uncultured Cetobacterium sp.]